MIKKARILSIVSTVSLCLIASKIATLFKINFIAGSYTAMFSGAAAVTPLSGLFGGTISACILFAINIIFRTLTVGSIPLYILAYHIPGLLASCYWALPNFIFRAAIPALCMLLFVIHPVGYMAAPYTLYWIVPIALFFMPTNNIFLHSLGSTLVAHAVGSVIWLYTVPMTSTAWLALIPVVAIERVLLALSMTALYYGVVWGRMKIISLLRNKNFAYAVHLLGER